MSRTSPSLPIPLFAVSEAYSLSPLNQAATELLEQGRVFRRAQLAPGDALGEALMGMVEQDFLRHSREGGNLNENTHKIPAFAGMTSETISRHDLTLPAEKLALSVWVWRACEHPKDDRERVLLAIAPRPMDATHSASTESAALMAAQLAHEIRNPLLAMTGAAQLLAKAGAQAELCELITREAERIERLLKALDPLRGSRDTPRTPVNIHALLDEAASSVEAGIGPHIVIRRRFDPSLPEVSADRDALVRAFTNLIKNAAEACSSVAQPTITLATRYDLTGQTRAVVVEVSDNGPGVAPALAAQIFHPFVTSKRAGRGLGLSIVARIIEDHGGRVSLLPPRKGTTCFCVELPVG